MIMITQQDVPDKIRLFLVIELTSKGACEWLLNLQII